MIEIMYKKVSIKDSMSSYFKIITSVKCLLKFLSFCINYR